jgi:hypothetical protein
MGGLALGMVAVAFTARLPNVEHLSKDLPHARLRQTPLENFLLPSTGSGSLGQASLRDRRLRRAQRTELATYQTDTERYATKKMSAASDHTTFSHTLNWLMSLRSTLRPYDANALFNDFWRFSLALLVCSQVFEVFAASRRFYYNLCP